MNQNPKLCFTKLQCALPGLRQFLATESYLSVIKNAFYFTLRALFVLKNFWSSRNKNDLIRKIWLIFKFIMLHPGNKQLEYTYCPISQEEKAIRQ